MLSSNVKKIRGWMSFLWQKYVAQQKMIGQILEKGQVLLQKKLCLKSSVHMMCAAIQCSRLF